MKSFKTEKKVETERRFRLGHGLRVANVVSSLESEAAGTTYTVSQITEATASLNNDVTVFSTASVRRSRSAKYARHIVCQPEYLRFGLARKLLISSSLKRMLKAQGELDIVHIHGLWRMPNVYPAEIARQRQIPLVLSPHGMLGKDALRFSWKQKWIFWHLAQRGAIQQVSCFHATSEQEYQDIRDFGLRRPVAIIPHGIDLPPFDSILVAPESPAAPYVLSLGRIHPKKALTNLIQAWALVADEFPAWKLMIVGPSEVGYADELRLLADTLGLRSVVIADAVFGKEKQTLLRNAELFALSTLNENFGMTVPESLVCGTPVISTKGAPWAGLEANGCGWWIDHGVKPLAFALRSAMRLSTEERRQMGMRGRDWMQRDFTWSAAGKRMVAVYRWLAAGASIPDYVRIE